jgi:hypothetical protein
MLTAGAVAIFAVKNVRTRLHEPKAHAAGVNSSPALRAR